MNPVFDPNKEYSWKAEDQFQMNGQQFMIALGALRAFLSTEEAAKIQLALQASQALQEVLAKAVEAGIAVERETPKE